MLHMSYLVCRRCCWWPCSPLGLPCVRRPPHGVAVGGLAFGLVCASVCRGCSCLWLGLSASYSASEEPHCLFWEPSLSATAGSWESATSPFWGSTSSQHGWLPLGNSPLLEIRKFQSSNVGKQIVNGIYCDVCTEGVLPAQRE